MTGLVLEGGTFRGTFSAGFMDALIEENIEFPYIVGVSAGISNAASYVSKQFGRNLEIFKKNTATTSGMWAQGIICAAKATSDWTSFMTRYPTSLCPLTTRNITNTRAASLWA